VKRPGWTSRWEDLGTESLEVFTGPDGREYIRAAKGAPADLELPMRYGLPPFRLTNIDHWHAPAAATR
jgi:hypothetical protein